MIDRDIDSVIYEVVQFINGNDKLQDVFYRRIIKKFQYDGYFNTAKLHKLKLNESDASLKGELNRIAKSKGSEDYLIKSIISVVVFNSPTDKSEAINEFVKVLISKYHSLEKCEFDKDNPFFVKRSDIYIERIFSLSDYIEKLTKIEIPKSSELFFRGHSDANYILLPSIFREDRTYKNEQFYYNSITRLCPKEFERFKNHIDQLVEMQHYELPTRLLDITRNALVALLFACIENQNSDAEVICFSERKSKIKYGHSHTLAILACLSILSYEQKSELNDLIDEFDNNIEAFNKEPIVQHLLQEIKIERSGFKEEINPYDLKKTILALPALNNDRIVRQSGAFFICGLIEQTDTANVAEDLNSKRLKVGDKTPIYIIDSNKKGIITRQLGLCDLNEATLFPEIDAVARYLKKYY